MKYPSNSTSLLSQIAQLLILMQDDNSIRNRLELLRVCQSIVQTGKRISKELQNYENKNKELQIQSKKKCNQIKKMTKKLEKQKEERQALQNKLENINSNKRNDAIKTETNYRQLQDKYQQLLYKVAELEWQNQDTPKRETQRQGQTPLGNPSETLEQSGIWLSHNQETIIKLRRDRNSLIQEVSILKSLYSDLAQQNQSFKYLLEEFTRVGNITKDVQNGQTIQQESQEQEVQTIGVFEEQAETEESDPQTPKINNPRYYTVQKSSEDSFLLQGVQFICRIFGL